MNLHTLYFFDKGLEEEPEEFSPSDIEGLQLWLDATDTDTLFQDNGFSSPVTTDGDPVGGWLDKSGNDRHIIQDTLSKRPLYKIGVQNGKGAILFDGADDFLYRANQAILSLVQSDEADIFFIIYQDSLQGRNGSIKIGGLSNELNIYATFDNVIYFDYGDSSGGGRVSVSQPTGWDDSFHILECYRSGANAEIVVDNSAVLTDTFSDSLGNRSYTLRIGPSWNRFFGGYKGEIIIYNRALIQTERDDITEYLSQKWGIAI